MPNTVHTSHNTNNRSNILLTHFLMSQTLIKYISNQLKVCHQYYFSREHLLKGITKITYQA